MITFVSMIRIQLFRYFPKMASDLSIKKNITNVYIIYLRRRTGHQLSIKCCYHMITRGIIHKENCVNVYLVCSCITEQRKISSCREGSW